MRDIKISPFLFFGVLLFLLGFPSYLFLGEKIFGENASNTLLIIGSFIAISIGLYLNRLIRKASTANGLLPSISIHDKTIKNFLFSPKYTLKRKMAIIVLATLSLVAVMALFVLFFIYNIFAI